MTTLAGRLWRRWKRIAEVIGSIQASFLLTIFYFVIVAPFALGVRLFSDPLRIKTRPLGSAWVHRDFRIPSLDEGRKQS